MKRIFVPTLLVLALLFYSGMSFAAADSCCKKQGCVCAKEGCCIKGKCNCPGECCKDGECKCGTSGSKGC